MRNYLQVIFSLVLAFFVISCGSDPLAQDLSSLQGTLWEYHESDEWDQGSFQSSMYLDFRTDSSVNYRYTFVNNYGNEIESGGDEFNYAYLYDTSVKHGFFIYEDGDGASFELRGNVLLLTMGSTTYLFHLA